MKSKVFKLIIILIVLIFAVYAVYYFISQTDLLVKEKTINLYFSTEDAMYLESEERTIKGKNLYIEALNSVIDGPSESELSKTIPTGVEILDVSKNNDILQVNFSEELVKNHWGGSTGERITVYSIVYTLTQFEGIDRVKFLIEGKEVDTLVGHMDLSVPVEPVSDILKSN